MGNYRRRAQKKPAIEQVLEKIYYDPSNPAGFASVAKLKAQLPASKRSAVLPWLRSQDVYTTFHPRRRRFPVNFYLATRADHCWELDLAIMDKFADQNDGFKYLFFVVDMFDKYLWVEPMKNKTAEASLAAFKVVLARANGRKPTFCRSDMGKEYDNSLLLNYFKRIGIRWQVAGNWSKAGLVEVTIKTVKSKLFRIFYYQGSQRYIDVLQDVVSAYNNSRHSRMGLAPAEVGENDAFYIWSRHYKRHVTGRPPPPRFRVGDYVRVLMKRKGALDDRGYKQGFKDEIFKIYRVQTKHQTGFLAQPLYHLVDLANEKILGGWVAHELTPVNFDPSKASYRINEILDTRINKTTRRKEYLVSFWSYPKSFNEWVEARQVDSLGIKKQKKKVGRRKRKNW